jgi:hypothetical protein
LYFGTQNKGINTYAKKAAIIAEGLSSYSRSKLHFCLDNTADNTSPSYNASISNSRMTILANGRVGIGTTLPEAGLHVSKSVNLSPSNVGYLSYNDTGKNWTPGTNSLNGRQTAIKTNNGGIWSDGFSIIVSSDRRIKENIVDVSDNKALIMLRDISCCWYNYKDRVEKGNERALGFIAQQVKEHLPEAVSMQKNIIPDKMKKIHTSWNDTKMSSNDLQDVSGIKYRFYVSNDISNNEKMIELVGDENDCFTFEEKWENVFCYGKEVDDFHTLDKQKLFALNFSATQEIDKIQQEEKAKLEAAEAKIATTETKLAAAEAEIAALKAKNETLESTLTNLLAELRANNVIS